MPKTNLKIYLDTSVISAYFDPRQLERLKLTQESWNKIKISQIFISEITLKELNETSDRNKRNKFMKFIKGFKVLPLNTQAENLAKLYKKAKIIPGRFQDDIYQLAIAVVFNMDYILSWNFKHMVNISVRSSVNAINVQNNYKTINILAPAEML